MKTEKEKDRPQLQPACNTKQKLERKDLAPSEEASALILRITDTYGTMLYEQAELVARKKKADHEITLDHVETALGILKERERRSWIKVLCGIASGVLIGAVLPLLESTPSISSIPIYKVLLYLTVGSVLAYYSASD
ncbi:MAG: hypothetical protein Q3M24_10980 [Candidatus Electrothrix aestuarii]|uniref:Uncharacterized protein n=1 Tax=Candidatus Electrothrix aestuarii TaxID=3062594 RepID=A0AAU8M139_9BACT|nr:hypothetical protein [Candidatus Electrothrix aestuarii]